MAALLASLSKQSASVSAMQRHVAAMKVGEVGVSEIESVYQRWVWRMSASRQVHVELRLVWGQTFCSTCLDNSELTTVDGR